MNIPTDDREEATALWFDWVRKVEAQREEEDRYWEEEDFRPIDRGDLRDDGRSDGYGESYSERNI